DTPQGPISLFGDGAVHFRAALGRAPAPLPLRCGPELVSRCARPPRAHRCPVTAGGRIRPPAAAAPAIRSGPPAEHRWNGGRTAGVQPVPGPSGRPRPFFPGTGGAGHRVFPGGRRPHSRPPRRGGEAGSARGASASSVRGSGRPPPGGGGGGPPETPGGRRPAGRRPPGPASHAVNIAATTLFP